MNFVFAKSIASIIFSAACHQSQAKAKPTPAHPAGSELSLPLHCTNTHTGWLPDSQTFVRGISSRVDARISTELLRWYPQDVPLFYHLGLAKQTHRITITGHRTQRWGGLLWGPASSTPIVVSLRLGLGLGLVVIMTKALHVLGQFAPRRGGLWKRFNSVAPAPLPGTGGFASTCASADCEGALGVRVGLGQQREEQRGTTTSTHPGSCTVAGADDQAPSSAVQAASTCLLKGAELLVRGLGLRLGLEMGLRLGRGRGLGLWVQLGLRLGRQVVN